MNNFLKASKFFLYLIPLAIVIVAPSTLFPFIVGKYVFFRTAVGLALIFFLLGLLFNKQQSLVVGRRLLVNPLVIAVSIFVLIFLLAGFFGVDPAFSFWSSFERGEGGLQMLYLGVFFLLMVLLFKEEKDWRIMFWISILAAGLMIFYGIAAGLKFQGYIGGAFGDEGFRFAGSIGNPAYVSVYLIFALFYVFYLLFNKYKQGMKSFGAVGLLILTVIFLVFFFLSATRGAFIGLIAAIFMAFLYLGFSIRSWRKWLLGIGVVALLAVGLLIFFRNATFIKSLPGSRVFDISFKTENFQNRMVVWKIAIDGFKERPLLGWGPENFSYTFDKHYNPKHYSITAGFGAWYDRAHNIFLDYLNQAGILGLLSFISVFIVFYWQFIQFNRRPATDNQQQKTGNRKSFYQLPITNALLFSIPIAYLVQGIALFDILPTYINLFLFLAFTVYKFSEDKQKN